MCNRHARTRALTGVPDLGRTRSRPLPLLVALPTCQEGVTLQYAQRAGLRCVKGCYPGERSPQTSRTLGQGAVMGTP